MMLVFHPSCFGEAKQTHTAPDLLPSEALLEFLLEFEGMDEEAFDLVIQRGVNDVEKHNVDQKTQRDTNGRNSSEANEDD